MLVPLWQEKKAKPNLGRQSLTHLSTRTRNPLHLPLVISPQTVYLPISYIPSLLYTACPCRCPWWASTSPQSPSSRSRSNSVFPHLLFCNSAPKKPHQGLVSTLPSKSDHLSCIQMRSRLSNLHQPKMSNYHSNWALRHLKRKFWMDHYRTQQSMWRFSTCRCLWDLQTTDKSEYSPHSEFHRKQSSTRAMHPPQKCYPRPWRTCKIHPEIIDYLLGL